MSKIDLSAFTKYLFTQDGKIMKSDEEFNEQIITIIHYKNYTWVCYVYPIHTERTQDVYNSIDYVENFLKLNEFIIGCYNSFKHIRFDIYVYVKYDSYNLSIDNNHFTCNSEELLTKLKEILNIESLNKLISE
jgi:hypothetical protein